MRAKTRASARARQPPRLGRKRRGKALRANPFIALVQDVRIEVDTRLAGLLDAKVDAARAHGTEVVALTRAFRDLCLRGGKRLRAALVVVGYRAASATLELEPALDAGVALELLHAYLLIHDDWMDKDDVRRGGPAVHALLTRRYRSAELGGSAAVLAGDLGVALATEALAKVDVPASRLPRVLAAFAQMQTDAIAGQQLDVLGGADIEKTYELKTGSYTVGGPLRMGALLAGAPSRLIADLERLALPTGVAFQLRDDLLSAFGNPDETGKPFANDVRGGKRTLLFERALGLASRADRAHLERTWGNARASARDLSRAVRILESCGARRAVEERIEHLTQKALEAARNIDLPEDRSRLLMGAIHVLTERRS